MTGNKLEEKIGSKIGMKIGPLFDFKDWGKNSLCELVQIRDQQE